MVAEKHEDAKENKQFDTVRVQGISSNTIKNKQTRIDMLKQSKNVALNTTSTVSLPSTGENNNIWIQLMGMIGVLVSVVLGISLRKKIRKLQ